MELSLTMPGGSSSNERVPAHQMLARKASDEFRHHGQIFAVPVLAIEQRAPRWIEVSYRTFEILIAVLGLIIASPVLAVAAILIYFDSPGPILFRHWRPSRSVKRKGKDIEGIDGLRVPRGTLNLEEWYYVPTYFRLVKFRTMYGDAPVRFPEMYAYDGLTVEEFRAKHSHIVDDPRITRVGKILRTLSIDELPNLWSVLTGDLRLVGPRPENPRVLQHYEPDEMYKFTCKPGITGLAQVSGRGLLSWGETLKLDLDYVRKRTIALDMKIILLTIKHVLTRHGAW